MISFLIFALVLLIVVYVIHLIIDQLGLPSNVKTIAYLIVGLVALVVLLRQLGVWL